MYNSGKSPKSSCICYQATVMLFSAQNVQTQVKPFLPTWDSEIVMQRAFAISWNGIVPIAKFQTVALAAVAIVQSKKSFCVLHASFALVCSSSCVLLQANLNDSHNQMVVHWAGEKSNVIVALARDSAGSSGPKTSSVSRRLLGRAQLVSAANWF